MPGRPHQDGGSDRKSMLHGLQSAFLVVSLFPSIPMAVMHQRLLPFVRWVVV